MNKVVVITGASTGVIQSRQPDVYTMPGAQQRIAAYYASLGVDGAAARD